MKKPFLIFFLNVTLFPLWGQGGSDSLRYSQENGTLEKQRFIDQYDYVFMTKEPTKWMLKTQLSNNLASGGLTVAYERKLSPSISLGIGSYYRPESSFRQPNGGVVAEIRYYYEMKKRMDEGKSANNFSGNYFGISMTQSFEKLSRDYRNRSSNPFLSLNPVLDAFELRWGTQRRFFNHGIIDFGASLGIVAFDNRDYATARNVYQAFLFQTQWSLGMAWGDFKRSKLPPTCDVLRCYDNNTQLLKIAWPNLIIGNNQQSLSTSFAFEKQLGKSRFSLNIQNDLQIDHWHLPNYFDFSTSSSADFSLFSIKSTTYLQPRFYFRKKTSTNSSLSGFYTGVSLMHFFTHYGSKSNGIGSYNNRYNTLEFGLSVGFQQKVFKHGYVDLSLTAGRMIHDFKANYEDKKWFLRPSLKVGFSF